MTNSAALILYTPIMIITVVIMAIAYHRDGKRPIIRSFIFMGITAIGWEIMTIVYFCSWSVPVALHLYDAKLPFVAFSTLAFFLFALRYYRLDQFIRPQLIAFLSIIPLITTALSVTSPWHDLLRTHLEIVSLWPRHTVIAIPGIWYWVHSIYCYILVVVVAIVAVKQHLKLPKSSRLPSLFMMVGVLITLICNILSVIGQLSYPFNLTSVSMGISAILFYLALCNCSKMDFLMLARSEIFHFIDDAVFVLDTGRKILDINRAAENCLTELGMTMPVGHYDDVLHFLEEAGAQFSSLEEHDQGQDFTLTTDHKTVVYNLREKRIIGEDGYEIGMFVTCTDVTRNRLLINRLEETAEIDPLTGLQNRRGLKRMISHLQQEDLPLTLIMGDINGLKEINDNYGHPQGDRLLQEAAQVLQDCCPQQGQAFRVGGDEFMLLLPRCDVPWAENIITEVHNRLDNLHTHPFRIAISLGTASIDHYPFSLDDLMSRADINMYQQKKSASAAS